MWNVSALNFAIWWGLFCFELFLNFGFWLFNMLGIFFLIMTDFISFVNISIPQRKLTAESLNIFVVPCIYFSLALLLWALSLTIYLKSLSKCWYRKTSSHFTLSYLIILFQYQTSCFLNLLIGDCVNRKFAMSLIQEY